eukprot:scaffold48077_cov33-Tisochrysis_lutea.AAC.2
MGCVQQEKLRPRVPQQMGSHLALFISSIHVMTVGSSRPVSSRTMVIFSASETSGARASVALASKAASLPGG